MTAKEKAIDLVVKMMETIPDSVIEDNTTALVIAKLHTLIVVEEIILLNPHSNTMEYWNEVKSEIEKQ